MLHKMPRCNAFLLLLLAHRILLPPWCSAHRPRMRSYASGSGVHNALCQKSGAFLSTSTHCDGMSLIHQMPQLLVKDWNGRAELLVLLPFFLSGLNDSLLYIWRRLVKNQCPRNLSSLGCSFLAKTLCNIKPVSKASSAASGSVTREKTVKPVLQPLRGQALPRHLRIRYPYCTCHASVMCPGEKPSTPYAPLRLHIFCCTPA